MKNQERGRNQVKKLDEIKLNDQLSSEGLSCDCCDESLALPRSSSLTPNMEQKQEEHRDHEEYEVTESKKLVNDKTLIVIGLVLTATIVILELMLPNSFTTGFIMFVLATPVQFLLGKQFYIRFLRAIKNRKRFTTDTLVVLSTSIAYLYSLFTLFSFTETYQFFEASSSVLTIFTIGEYLERRVLKTTNESLKNLLTLKPKAAIVIRDGKEVSVNSDDIIIGDIVIAKPGEKIAVDGVVVDGKTSIDESMITGESIPVDREIGDNVIGGTINKNGYIQFKATKVGSTTVLANIIEIVKKARSSKASVQRIADKAVQFFIHRSNIDVNIGMLSLDTRNTFGCGDEIHQFNVMTTTYFQEIDSRRGTSACRQHGIKDQEKALFSIQRQLAIVLYWFHRLRIAIKANVTNFCCRDEVHDTVYHAKPCTQDGNNADGNTSQSACFHF